MTRTATRRFYVDLDSAHFYNPSSGYHAFGGGDHHLPLGVSDNGLINYSPVFHFPFDWSGMAAFISAQMIVTLVGPVHMTNMSTYPYIYSGRANQAVPWNGSASNICGGSGWETSGIAFDAVAWEDLTIITNAPGYSQPLDVTNTVRSLFLGSPNHGIVLWTAYPGSNRTEFGSMETNNHAYIDVTYEVPNEAPYQPYAVAPPNGSSANDPSVQVRADSAGDIDGDPAANGNLQYGVVDSYGVESWQAQIGYSVHYGGYHFGYLPTLTRGKWHCFRAATQDHHGAWSAWSAPWWHHLNALPSIPTLTGGMQPIHNLAELATWSGPEAKPQLSVYVSDPDGDAINYIDIEISATAGGALLWSGGFPGWWGSGTTVLLNHPFGFPNDVDRFVRCRVRDSNNNLSAWSGWVAMKVRWAQAIYQYQAGVGAGQYAFSLGTVAGSSPSAVAIFRGATGANGVGAGGWRATVNEVGSTEWLNILVRLAIGRNTSVPTSVTDMTLQFLGTAEQPDLWDFPPSSLDPGGWQLDENKRRYGTKSLRWLRSTGLATGQTAIAHTGTVANPHNVPVVPDTQYTLSVWVWGTLEYGDLRGYVQLKNGTILAETEVITDTLGGWHRLRVTFTTDANTSLVAVGVRYTVTAGGVGDIFWVDAVQIEEGPVASVWNPGQTGAVIVDVGGIFVNANEGATFRLRGSRGQLRDTVELSDKGLLFGGGGGWQVWSDGTKLWGTDSVGTNWDLAGGGSQGPAGPAGPAGPTGQAEAWHTGAGTPLGTLGAVGDLYLDTVTGNVYEKMAGSTWTVRVNIIGPVGPAGPQGIAGPQGPQGIQGIQGPPGLDGVGSTLDSLTDVSVPTPAHGAALVYDDPSDTWVAGSPAVADHGALTGLADDDHGLYPVMVSQTGIPATPVASRPTLWYDTDEVGGFYASPSGTAFPSSPVTNQRFFRTDIRGGMWFVWDGTYWLSETRYHQSRNIDNQSTVPVSIGRIPLWSDLAVHLDAMRVSAYVVTPNTASVYWVFRFAHQAAAVDTVLWDGNTAAVAPDGWRVVPPLLTPALLPLTATSLVVLLQAKNGAPGNIYVEAGIDYRLRAT
jgi:hypothetical protein